MPKRPNKPTTQKKFVNWWAKTKDLAASPVFAKRYAFVSVGILLTTTLVWSLLGASIESSNADQLVNTYLLAHKDVFHSALLASQHTFLFKWPLFFIVNLLGASAQAFALMTVLISLATVGLLALFIYKLEKRPLIFGTICLALASVLLLVPIQSYPGAILPVDMAMLTTRNLEYILYILGIYFLVRSAKTRTWRFWLGVSLLSILIASDKLFLTLSLGGAGLALIAYALRSRWNYVSLTVRWLLGGVAAAAVSIIVIKLLSQTTHILGQASGLGPYGVVHNFHDLIVGCIYAVTGIFTNFGANPAFAATEVKSLPHQFFNDLFSVSGPAYIVNFLILFAGIFAAWRLLVSSFANPKSQKSLQFTPINNLALALIWSSVAALGSYIVTNHYFAVDARYLTILLFTLFISAAVFSRRREWQTGFTVIASATICIGIIFGLFGLVQGYKNDKNALLDVNRRNELVTQAITHHKVDVLVGDYWRVVPIKLKAHDQQNVLPLANCTTERDVLSSKAWQTNLDTHSFAYLLSLDKGLTGYPACSLDHIINTYGRPNDSVVISGSQANPKELLLFYDQGANNKNLTPPKTPVNVLPISLSQLPYTSCPIGTTVMNIVAHEDDDLLFINPDTLNTLKSSHCVRTVYITAGDSGAGQFYWLSREQGSEAAYSQMLGSSAAWTSRSVEVAPNEYIYVAHPKSDYRASLVFMHLPDGGSSGSGFKDSLYQSLSKLEDGKVTNIYSVDNQSVYTLNKLVDAIASLIHTYQPVEIRTQANYISPQHLNDHSDHVAVGRLVKLAYTKYDSEEFENSLQIPLKFYIGYPIHGMPTNVTAGDLSAKEAAWFAYASHDPAVCHTKAQCDKDPAYGFYLTRQYQNSN